ncbi:acetylornithine deacetylase [beta proteobacterium AAP99]|nr:acetylornithine deacetylase [beta proteobacterium AAP99]
MNASLPTQRLSNSVEMLRQLVSFNTISAESNLGLIEFSRDWLAAQGVKSRLIYDSTGKKANLFATVGEGAEPGVILSGHTDVVPVVGQPWSTDPFTLTEREGKLYGRGSADMKGFIACALNAVPGYLASPLAGERPFHLALSYDEEIGCFGVWGLIKDIQESGAKVSACIVGEPSSMQPIVAHKGTHRFRCCVRGKEAHSANTNQGVNAIHYASRLMSFLQARAEQIAAGETPDANYPVPTSTVSVTMIDGGTGANIIPLRCDFTVDVRTLPGTSFAALLDELKAYARTLEPEMKAVAADAGIDVQFIASIEGFGVTDADPLLAHVTRLAGSQRKIQVSFGTEAGIFQRAGIPTIVIGPGNIDQAHQPDEFVEIDQIAQCDAFLTRLLAEPFSN